MGAGKAHDLGPLDVEFGQGGGEGDGLGQPVFGQAPGRGGFQRRMQDEGPRRPLGGVAQTVPLAPGEEVVFVLGIAGDQSSPS
jgi:hypothetical protein